MFFNIDLFIVIIAVIAAGIFIYTYYNNIFLISHKPSNTKPWNPGGEGVGLSYKFKLALVRLSFMGTVSTHVNSASTSNSTTVYLSDDDLNSLLEALIREIGNTREISITLLESYGLDTITVINYLVRLGYIIIT